MNPKVFLTSLMVLASLVVLIGMVRGEHSIAGYFSLKDSRDVLSDAVSKLHSENARISGEILKLKKSKSYAKKVLRDKYHITEEGEKIIFFAD